MFDEVKPEVDELDDWFNNVEEDGIEDQAAADDAPDAGVGSPETSAEDSAPAQEVHQDDAGDPPPSNDGTSAEAKPKDADPYSWVADLPPEVRDHAEALVRRDQSNTGRVAALRSRLDQVEAEQEAKRSTGSRPPSKEASPTAPDGEMTDDELKEFMTEFPSVARNVSKMVAQQVAKEREEILGAVRPIQEEAAQRHILDEKTRLRTEAEKIFNTAETGIHYEDVIQSVEWRDWFAAQPEAYKTFVQTANDAESAAIALRDFDRYAREAFAPSPAAPKGTSKADLTAARRQQTLEADTPPSRSAPIDDKGVGDYDAYFNQAVRESGYKV